MPDRGEQAKVQSGNERRQLVRDQLHHWHPFLAVMYDDILGDLQSLQSGGDRRLLVMHISHNMREIMNGIGEARGLSMGPEVNPASSSLVDQLPALAERFTLDLSGDGLAVEVPRPLAEHLQKLMDSAVKEHQRSEGQVAELFSLQDNPKHPAVRGWRAARKLFLGFVHWERLREKVLPSVEQLMVQMQDLEDYAVSESSEFFALADEIKDITRLANSEEDLS